LIELQPSELEGKFCDALLESIDEAITGLLSREVVDALYLNLQTVHSISRDEVPHNLEALCSALDKIFGPHSTGTICKAIARKLYVKLGLTFYNDSGRTLIEYVEEAKIKVREKGA
jgi:hypothetical protein